jgi:hypothetical protein
VRNSPDDNVQSTLREWLAASEAPAAREESDAREAVPDDALLAALREALAAREAVPSWFVEAGKSAYAWRDIDAELAQLTFDSLRDAELTASTRSESASIRALTFQSARITIEVEITGDALLGQLIPPRDGTAEMQTQVGHISTTSIDEVGCFVIEPKPDSPFRLRVRTEGQADVVTGWLTI